jgi:hypothetical protein
MFLDLLDPDPDPLVRGMDPDPDPIVRGLYPDPDPDPLVRGMDVLSGLKKCSTK